MNLQTKLNIERIEREAEELYEYTQHDYSPVKPHDFIANFGKAERNLVIDEVIELIKEWGDFYTRFGDDPINREIIEDINKKRVEMITLSKVEERVEDKGEEEQYKMAQDIVSMVRLSSVTPAAINLILRKYTIQRNKS